MPKQLLILKVGSTFPELAATRGDFEDWIADGLCRGHARARSAIRVVNAVQDGPLPSLTDVWGIVVTGSHAMVTDDAPWCRAVAMWLRDAITAQVPTLGICFGHQLLAQAAGGTVGYHDDGPEMGRVLAHALPRATDDPIFGRLPAAFHTLNGHFQFVHQLPPGAVALVTTERDSCHAFRLGNAAWGVQFHPEFDETVTAVYLDQSRDALGAAGLDAQQLIAQCAPTPVAAQVLGLFREFATDYARETRGHHANTLSG
ncbi:MAG: glutamine amidotransferase [Caldilineaceae bacterium]|nr:glutamine amidotransferase [Caldilineaceae bacterium]